MAVEASWRMRPGGGSGDGGCRAGTPGLTDCCEVRYSYRVTWLCVPGTGATDGTSTAGGLSGGGLRQDTGRSGQGVAAQGG